MFRRENSSERFSKFEDEVLCCMIPKSNNSFCICPRDKQLSFKYTYKIYTPTFMQHVLD